MIEALADLARTAEVQIWVGRVIIFAGVVVMAAGLYVVIAHVLK